MNTSTQPHPLFWLYLVSSHTLAAIAIFIVIPLTSEIYEPRRDILLALVWLWIFLLPPTFLAFFLLVQKIKMRKNAFEVYRLPLDPYLQFKERAHQAGFLSYLEWLTAPYKQLTPRQLRYQLTPNDRLYSAIIASAIISVGIPLLLIPATYPSIFQFSLLLFLGPPGVWLSYEVAVPILRYFLIALVNFSNRGVVKSAEWEIEQILTRSKERASEANISSDHGEIIRGWGLSAYTEVDQAAASKNSQASPTVNFAGLPIQIIAANQHMLFHAMTGAGKSQLIELALQSVLHQIWAGKNVRVVTHDVGGSIQSKLRKAQIPFILVNPYDPEGVNWLTGIDCHNAESAVQIAKGFSSLKPVEKRHEYFDEGVAQIIAATMIYLIETNPHRWSLADVCELARDEDQLIEVLKSTDFGRGCLALISKDTQSRGDMLASVSNTMNRFYLAAKQMKQRSSSFTIREWVENPGQILLLSYPSNKSEILQPLYGMLFQAIFEELLSQPPLNYKEQAIGARQSFIFLDELLALPVLPSLPKLQNEGRKFGVSIILGMTSKAACNAKYSETVTDGMVNNCGNRFFGRCKGQDAEWSSKMFFSVLTKRQKISKSKSSNTSNTEETSTGKSQSDTSTSGSSYQPDYGNTDSSSRSHTSAQNSSTSYGTQTSTGEAETVDEHISFEEVIHPSEFANYPDPFHGGAVHGVIDTPYGACKVRINTSYTEEQGIRGR